MAMQVGELFASFSLDTSGFAQAVVGIEGELEQMGARIAAIGSGFEHYLTTPIKNFAESALSAGLNFSSQMSAVEAISGATGESLEALRQAAIDAGSETSFTATQAGEALEYMAMAGWQTEDMLSGLRPIMDLAAASGADLASTSDIVTDAMTALGYSADETWKVIKDGTAVDTGISNVQHFADVLAATATNSNTNVEMLGQSFKYAAPLAGALGYSVEDVALALGLMANQGVKASQAGTTLRSLFKRLADPPKAAKDAMNDYGISLTDTSGKMKDLSVILDEMRVKAAAMTETEKAAFAANIAGTTGMSGFLALLNSTTEDYDQLTAAIENCSDATDTMASVKLDNAQGAITILKSAVEGLQITLFSLYEDSIKETVKWLTDLVNAFREADSFVQNATVAFLGLAAGIGPAMKAFGFLLPALAGMVTPLGALTAGLGLFALSFMDYATVAGSALDESGNYVARGAGKIETAIREMSGGALTKLKRFSITAESYIYSIADYMPGMINALQESSRKLIPQAVETMITLFSAAFGGISQNLEGIVDLGAGIISGILEGIAGATPKLMTNLSRIMSNILTTFTNVDRLRTLGSTISSAFRTAFDSTDWERAGQLLSTSLEKAVSNIREMSTEMVGFLDTLDISDFGQKLQDGLAGASGWLKDTLLGPDFSEGTWGDVGAQINGWIRDGFERVGTWLKQLILGHDFSDGSTWMDVGKRVWEWIRAGFEGTSDFLLGLILGENFSTQTSRWTDAGTQIWTWIRSGFEGTSDFLLSLILGADFNSSSTWTDAGRKIWDDIKSGFEVTEDFLKNLILGGEGSEGTWMDVGARIGGWLQTGLSSIGNFLYTFLMGDEGTGSSWYAAGVKIGSAIRDGMASIGEFIKALILGDDYASGGTWVEAGKKIWGWIQNGFEFKAGLLEGAILGSGGTGSIDWAARGQQIWQMIQSGFSYAGNFLAKVLGVEGDASADWGQIGAAIWNRIKSGFDNSGHFLEGILLGEGATGEGWTSIGRTIWSGLQAGLSEASGYIGRLLFGEESGTGIDWVARGRKVSEGIQDGMEGLKNLLAVLLGLEGDTATDWGQIGSTIFQGILDGLSSAASAAGDFLTGLILGDQATEGSSFADVGAKAWEGIRSGFIDAMQQLGSIAGAMAEDILRFEWLPVGVEIGAGLLKGIMTSLTTLRQGLETFLHEVFLGVKYAVLSWFGIEVDEMTRTMESMTLDFDGGKITASALNSLIGSSSATITEQARAWVALVQAGFEEQINTLNFSPTAVALAAQIESGLLGEQDRINAAAALIFSGFGEALMMQDFGLYADGKAMMEELYRGIEEGTDVTKAMCEQLGIAIPMTVAEAIGMGDWGASGTAVTAGMQSAMENVSAEADALVASLGLHTADTYIGTINDGLAGGKIDGDPVRAALEEAATQAAEATGSQIGQSVMDAASQALQDNRETLATGAAAVTDPANFGQAEANASAAGGQIGGAIAPEITAKMADVETAISALVDAIGIGFEPVQEKMRSSADLAMAGILESFSIGRDPIMAAVQQLIDDIQAAFSTLTIDLSAVAGLSGVPDTGALAGTGSGLSISGSVDALVKDFSKLSGQLAQIAKDEMASVQDILNTGSTSLQDTTALLRDALTSTWQDMSTTIQETTTTMYSELQTISESGTSDLESLMQHFVQQMEQIYTPIRERLTAITQETMAGMQSEINNGSIQMTNQISNLVTTLESTFHPVISGLTNIASEAMSGMTGAVNAQSGSLSGAAGSAASSAVSSARNAMNHDKGYSIGQNFVSGIQSGIQSAASSLAQAATTVVNNAVSAVKSALKINSPSRVTMEIGENMDEGIALGLQSGHMVLAAGMAVEDAVRAMADSASITDVSRGTVLSSGTQARQTGVEAARAMEDAHMDDDTVERVATILADRLIASGAFGGDVYMDGSKVGECVATPVSRRISDDVRRTVRGRRAAGILS